MKKLQEDATGRRGQATAILKDGLAHLRESWRWLLLLHVPIGFLLLAAVVVSVTVPGVSLYSLTSDPTAVAGVPFYAGCLSQVGMLLWCATATTIWVTRFVLGGRVGARPETRRFLLLSGALVTVLMLDDVYLLHEEVVASYLRVPEEVLLAGYALLAVVLLWSSRSEILRGPYGLFVLALGLLGASVLCDLVPEALCARVQGLQKLETLIEEGSKLMGLATWLAFYVRYAGREIRLLDRGVAVRGATAGVP